jgi:hypothetical protein
VRERVVQCLEYEQALHLIYVTLFLLLYHKHANKSRTMQCKSMLHAI